jgi:Tfp pilus assembly protein PilE
MRLRVLLLVAFAVSCSKPRTTLTPEAAGLFARADEPGPGSSLVVDLEAMRAAGLLPKSAEKSGSVLLEMVSQALPALAVEAKSDPAGPRMMRAAVLVAFLRDWDGWATVQRYGIISRGDPTGQDPLAIADNVLVAAATRGDQKQNQELLRGLAALDRASQEPRLTWQGENLCVVAAGMPAAVCAKAGEGYIAIATASALGKLPPAGTVQPSTALVRLRADVPDQGKGELLVEAKDGLRLAVSVHTDDVQFTAKAEKELQAALVKWDASSAATRTAMAPVLTQTQGALAADAEAPASLKKAAAAVTLDTLLDRRGHMADLRKSVKVTRAGGDLSAEATLSRGYLDEVLSSGGLYVGVAAAGIAAAIAVPSFVTYECRSKQSEAKSGLKLLFVSQKAYFQEKDTYGATFDEIGFMPDPGNYTYCMDGKCQACTKPGCHAFTGENHPCAKLAPADPRGDRTTFRACAMADIDGDGTDFDVWTIDDEGQPENVANDCE